MNTFLFNKRLFTDWKDMCTPQLVMVNCGVSTAAIITMIR